MRARAGITLLFATLGALAVHDAPVRSGDVRALRSTVVYPEQRIALRMNHGHPAHRKLRCVRCHVDAGTSDRAADRLIPREASCLPCHEDRIARDEPTAERCGFCHVGYAEENGRVVPASDFPTPRLSFSHAVHVREEGMKCLTCHAGVTRATVATRAHLPTMKQCFECHGGEKPTAPSACRTCHLTQADGRLRDEWPEGSMNPPRWLFGMHHDREWLVTHRWVGADHGSLCASCHAESDCADCHDGRVSPPRVHPNDFLTTHAQMARRDDPSCTSCHRSQSFCLECHARLGVSPIAAPRVRASARFHPPAEVWLRGPVQHAAEARRSMSACASCHAENDCVQCHGVLGIGAGLSPHPPGFRARCAEALRHNDRACRTCHGDDVSALAARCR